MEGMDCHATTKEEVRYNRDAEVAESLKNSPRRVLGRQDFHVAAIPRFWKRQYLLQLTHTCAPVSVLAGQVLSSLPSASAIMSFNSHLFFPTLDTKA